MSNLTDQHLAENISQSFADPNRHLVEVPDTFAIARWRRDADVTTIARCILGTLKYEPHAADTTLLRRALEAVMAYRMPRPCRSERTPQWMPEKHKESPRSMSMSEIRNAADKPADGHEANQLSRADHLQCFTRQAPLVTNFCARK
jgi:hypothetical protein